MRPWSYPLHGRYDELTIHSDVLADNPLGDPADRPLWVYVPPGYDEQSGAGYPSVYVIQGMTGQLDMWRNRSAFRKNFPELVDDLFADPTVPRAIVVFVDCWTSYGGSQYLNSPGDGSLSHVPVRRGRSIRRCPLSDGSRAADRRAIAGKSSGGYGAMVTPMLRPDVFGAFATHAGDALFEVCYPARSRTALDALRDQYEGSFERFRTDFQSRPALSKAADDVLINEWAMAACYSADTDGTIHLPFDVATGRLVPDTWERWLAWDPVRMAPRRADALRSMRGIWIDAGRRDEYHLDLGAEAFRRELAAAGVPDPAFELFDAGHGAIEYRYPLSLRYLLERIAR